jgi:RNA polymerase sigma-70 factor (ECF subfamily)
MSQMALPFEALYATHYQRIYRHVYRLVGHHEQAEDLTQAAFLNAWRAWPPAQETNLTGWLYTIATRVALDALAHQRRLYFQSLDELVEWLEEAVSGTREDEACLERLHLTEALRHLPVTSCTLLLLSAQGYSATELGRCRGLHKATLARQLASARAELSRYLMEEHV